MSQLPANLIANVSNITAKSESVNFKTNSTTDKNKEAFSQVMNQEEKKIKQDKTVKNTEEAKEKNSNHPEKNTTNETAQQNNATQEKSKTDTSQKQDETQQTTETITQETASTVDGQPLTANIAYQTIEDLNAVAYSDLNSTNTPTTTPTNANVNGDPIIDPMIENAQNPNTINNNQPIQTAVNSAQTVENSPQVASEKIIHQPTAAAVTLANNSQQVINPALSNEENLNQDIDAVIDSSSENTSENEFMLTQHFVKAKANLDTNTPNTQAKFNAHFAQLFTQQATQFDQDNLFLNLHQLGNVMGKEMIQTMPNQVYSNLPTQTVPMINHTTPFGQADWNNGFGDKIVMMLKNNLHSAEIKIYPPDLGTIHAKIKMDGTQADLSFTTQHSAVKDALENSLPRLRELLAQSGLSLGDVSVATQQRQQQHSDQGNFQSSSTDAMVTAETEEEISTSSAKHTIVMNGLVDYYA
ncbi:MAG: flagellar hook-length control protein FliK [Legionellales bacterium]|nr:flagellar hook-length control protein FliK [Legionellales bacterium]